MRVERCRPIYVLIICFLALAAAAQTQAPAPVVMTVIRPVANMYSSATTDVDVVSQAIYGTNVSILETKEGWVRVRTPDDYTGWMETAALRSKPAAGDVKPKLVRVTSLFAHIYREPDVTTHQPLITLPFETQLETAPPPADNSRWLTVRLLDGTQGMIQAGDVSADAKLLTIDETIALAKRFLGLPYTWGGTSSYGYDCSGFVQMLMRQRGIVIPRDADLQAAWNGFVTVERDQVQPGDLLYFGSAADKVSHTGMYIGDNQFINATTYQHPVVRLDTLSEPRWTRLLVGIRRPKS